MSPAAQQASAGTSTRPRVEGGREQEIFDATLQVLAEVGYDRLTLDAVAAEAKASKATLYRRWNGKAQLVIDALIAHMGEPVVTDTGTLRGDLIATYCGMGGVTDRQQMALVGSLITAVSRDPEFAEVYRRDVVAPKIAVNDAIFERAKARGEIAADVDLALVSPCLPGIVLHRLFFLGETPTEDLITRVIDQVIMPAVTRG
ncbi:TetR family transcriptional regulator [Aeromicrobium sp. Root236]|uniref:TetR/AcrR family transcriptional regulator n=1 Tax=Aeromicrobium sp. Root236 TaxID=1736498 RepID=UPI0006FB5512|nr:TetR/AcrR family transcriptional regulator [Aeromicrobium sp. Root236]KRC63461.1 TetR family transcriptional regulator [Aeromicrobium sp. Root236]